jgi:hypothetical protein
MLGFTRRVFCAISTTWLMASTQAFCQGLGQSDWQSGSAPQSSSQPGQSEWQTGSSVGAASGSLLGQSGWQTSGGSSASQQPGPQMGQSDWQQPAAQPGQSNWQQPAPQMGQSNWQQPAAQSGQSNWQQPTSQPGQSNWQQPAPPMGQQSAPPMGQSNWQQPAAQSGQSNWQQPAPPMGQQPAPQMGQSNWQQPAAQSGQSNWQQPAQNGSTFAQNDQQPIQQVDSRARPKLQGGATASKTLGDALQQEQQPQGNSTAVNPDIDPNAAAMMMNTLQGGVAANGTAGSTGTSGGAPAFDPGSALMGALTGGGGDQLNSLTQTLAPALMMMMEVMPGPGQGQPAGAGFGLPRFGQQTGPSYARPMARRPSNPVGNIIPSGMVRNLMYQGVSRAMNH